MQHGRKFCGSQIEDTNVLCVVIISRNYIHITAATAFPFGLPFSAFFILPLLRGHLGHYLILLHPQWYCCLLLSTTQPLVHLQQSCLADSMRFTRLARQSHNWTSLVTNFNNQGLSSRTIFLVIVFSTSIIHFWFCVCGVYLRPNHCSVSGY